MTTFRLFYSGDVNIEYGGIFYNLADWKDGYADVVRVQPCSDAGGPDNCHWLEHLVVNIPSGQKLATVLESCGYLSGSGGTDYNAMTLAQRRHIIVQACVSYGLYDQMSSTLIRIGKQDPFFSGSHVEWEPQTEYSSRVSLKRLARQTLKELL